MEAKHRVVALYAFILLFGYFSYLVLAPFFTYLILGLVFAFFFHPCYSWLAERMPRQLASAIILVTVLLCILLPSAFFGASLFAQAADAYELVHDAGIASFDAISVADFIQYRFQVDLRTELIELFEQGRLFIKSAIPGIITNTGALLLGIFIMLFALYYAVQDGAKWLQYTFAWLPLKPKHQAQLYEKVKVESKALLYGQIVTSIFIGVINGFILGMAGIPNAVFWGFLMIVIGIIPVVGAFFVYVPAGIFLLWQHEWLAGIAVLVLCAGVHIVIDLIIRPKMISETAKMHPLFVILGAFGGIALMGLVGFLIGPLILSFFVTLLSFDYSKK